MTVQEEQGINSTHDRGSTDISHLNTTDGKPKIVKQDSLRRNYHAEGLKSLQHSSSKLYKSKKQRIAPLTSKNTRQRSAKMFIVEKP